jgi:aspartyl aminopeptidase
LSIAGRVIIADNTTGSFTSKLVKIDRPLLRIPTLAIHLDRTVNENFRFNAETEFTPILGQLSSQFNAKMKKDHSPTGGEDDSACHQPALLQLVADELSVKPDEIRDFEL